MDYIHYNLGQAWWLDAITPQRGCTPASGRYVKNGFMQDWGVDSMYFEGVGRE